MGRLAVWSVPHNGYTYLRASFPFPATNWAPAYPNLPRSPGRTESDPTDRAGVVPWHLDQRRSNSNQGAPQTDESCLSLSESKRSAGPLEGHGACVAFFGSSSADSLSRILSKKMSLIGYRSLSNPGLSSLRRDIRSDQVEIPRGMPLRGSNRRNGATTAKTGDVDSVAVSRPQQLRHCRRAPRRSGTTDGDHAIGDEDPFP